jgi:hypothetical protein
MGEGAGLFLGDAVGAAVKNTVGAAGSVASGALQAAGLSETEDAARLRQRAQSEGKEKGFSDTFDNPVVGSPGAPPGDHI